MPNQVLVPADRDAVIEIASFPWQEESAWRPQTTVRLRREPGALFVRFEVRDSHVLARTQEFDGPVYEDSCVEFFFDPGIGRYFNIEVNAAGGTKFNLQRARGVEVHRLSPEDADMLEFTVDPGTLIVPEVSELDWSVSYRIPLDLLRRFGSIDEASWRGNFYKCAEANSHPHFGSWSPIRTSEPDFHRPEFFGEIRFDQSI